MLGVRGAKLWSCFRLHAVLYYLHNLSRNYEKTHSIMSLRVSWQTSLHLYRPVFVEELAMFLDPT